MSSSASTGTTELRVGSKFRLIKKIGSGTLFIFRLQLFEFNYWGVFVPSGSFGDIYLGADQTTNEEVAVKLESIKARHPPLLHFESKLYRVLQGGVGIPNIRWYGVEGDYNVLGSCFCQHVQR